MSLVEHLLELRKRIVLAALAIAVGAVVGWFLFEPLWDLLRAPIEELTHERDAAVNYTYITEAFDLRMQIALTAGIVLSCPVWLYQAWAYIMPALLGRERAYALGFVFTAVPLFFAGCVVGFVVFPNIIELMGSFVPEGDTSLYQARYYLDFVLKLVLATGVAFVFPVVLVLLNFLGVIQGMTILKGWRVAIIVIALFAALATPASDVVSMGLLSAPLIGLYLVACLIAILHDRLAARRLNRIREEATA